MPFNLRPMLLSLYQNLKASFWLIPLCMLVGSLIVAPLVVELDLYLVQDTQYEIFPEIRLSVEGARMILSSIAGSMITVASLVFSMTLVALSLVAQQLGPRILQIFMEDRLTQIVLGLFIATFLFAMVVLGSIGFGEDGRFIPKVSVFVSGGLVIVAFAAVILFVHHIARQIQADVIIFNTAQKLRAAMKDLPDPDEDGSPDNVDRERYEEIRADFDKNACEIVSRQQSGYVQYVDMPLAFHLAKEHDLQITLLCRPGHFVLPGRPLLKAAPERNLDDKVRDQLANIAQLNARRTREQQVEFEMLALVEIALRALSKGINDPFTAISCIDWLSAGFANLMSHYPDYRVKCDDDGTPRVLEYPQTFERYLKRTFNPIREAGKDVPIVLDRLHHTLSELKSIADHQAQKRALDEQLSLLEEARG